MEVHERSHLEKWHVQSSDTPGFHAVITPEQCECQIAQIFRLNLLRGQYHHLKTGNLEMHPVLISGSAFLSPHRGLKQSMEQFDSFYLPARDEVVITATSDCIFYIAAANYEGIGEPSFRKFNHPLPQGNIHQIHDSDVGEREIMFTLDPSTPASHLICGLIPGGVSTRTVGAPNQHQKNLEEIYCYFDMDFPFGHPNGEHLDRITSNTVRSGTIVQAPAGFHLTETSPSVQNTYLWVLASYTPRQRRYDFAILDSIYCGN